MMLIILKLHICCQAILSSFCWYFVVSSCNSVAISNLEVSPNFLYKFICGLMYFYLFLKKFLLRKSFSLNNASSSLLNFIENSFELTELGSYSSFLVSAEVCLISIFSLLFHSLQTATLLHTGYEIWFCNDWIQPIVRVCLGKFEVICFAFSSVVLFILIISVVLFILIISVVLFILIISDLLLIV